MLLRYEQIKNYPQAFSALTGLTLAGFDELMADMTPRLAQAEEARLSRPVRKRAIGAGHPFELSAVDQVMLTLFWLKHRHTHEIVGYLFGVSKPVVSRVLNRILPVLGETRGGEGSLPHARAFANLQTLLRSRRKP